MDDDATRLDVLTDRFSLKVGGEAWAALARMRALVDQALDQKGRSLDFQPGRRVMIKSLAKRQIRDRS